MLVQLSSLPIAIAIPTLASQFDVGVEDVALMVVAYLTTLGSFVLLSARIGDYIGHSQRATRRPQAQGRCCRMALSASGVPMP